MSSGDIRRIGRYRDSSWKDFGSVATNQQVACFTNPASNAARLILYKGGTWAGKYAGNPVGRVGLHWSADDAGQPGGKRPGGVAAYTNEFTPSVNMTGAYEGNYCEASLATPFVTEPGYAYQVSVTNRSGTMGVAMMVAAEIAETNERFYRKNTESPNYSIPVDGVGSDVSNQGQLIAWFEGEVNVAPSAPTGITPSGDISTLTPTIGADFNDLNKVLNDGRAWDKANRVHIQVRKMVDQTTMWDSEITVDTSSRTTNTYAGTALLYFTSYQVRIRHRDRLNEWGAWSGWVTFRPVWSNRAPNQPGAVTRIGGESHQRPTMEAAFSDPDETLPNGQPYDYMAKSYHEVWWGGSLRWSQQYNSTTDEINNRESSRQVGIDIPFDTPYTYYVWHIDYAGTWSPVRSYSGTVKSSAAVNTPLLPASFVANPANPGTITAGYVNNSGLNTNAVEVRLVSSNGTPYAWSGAIAKTVAPGANISLTWAETNLGTRPYGEYAGIQVVARDTNNIWSEWSGAFWFTVNSPPYEPVINSPAPNGAAPVLPVFEFNASDPNGPITNAFCRLEKSNGDGGWNLVGEWPTPYISGSTFRLDLAAIGGLAPGYGTFRIRATVGDGALSTDSAWRTFIFAAVPTVAITAPSGPNVSTTQPAFTWTCANQTAWRMEGWIGDTCVYNTGNQSGSVKTHTIATVANWQNNERWNRGEKIGWRAFAQDSSTQWGASPILELTLDYPPITELIIGGMNMSFPGVDGSHYVECQVAPSTYPMGQFQHYTWQLAEITGHQGSVIPGTLRDLKQADNVSDTTLQWFELISRKWYRIFAYQTVRIGNDTMSSAPVSIDMMVEWDGTLIHSNADPLASYVWLRYSEPGGRYSPRLDTSMGRNNYWSRGSSDPVAFMDGRTTTERSGTFSFLPTEGKSAIEQANDLWRIYTWQDRRQAPNGRPNGITYRDGRGYDWALMYVTMALGHEPHHTVETVELAFEKYHRRLTSVGGGS